MRRILVTDIFIFIIYNFFGMTTYFENMRPSNYFKSFIWKTACVKIKKFRSSTDYLNTMPAVL